MAFIGKSYSFVDDDYNFRFTVNRNNRGVFNFERFGNINMFNVSLDIQSNVIQTPLIDVSRKLNNLGSYDTVWLINGRGVVQFRLTLTFDDDVITSDSSIDVIHEDVDDEEDYVSYPLTFLGEIVQ